MSDKTNQGYKMCPYCANIEDCNIREGIKQYYKTWFPKAKGSQIIIVTNFIAELCPVYRFNPDSVQTKKKVNPNLTAFAQKKNYRE